MTAITDAALDQVFLKARSHSAFRPEPVPEETLRRLYQVLKMGPTSLNCAPANFLFLASPAAKARLEPHVGAGNRKKVMGAPVVVVIGYDTDFPKRMTGRFPDDPALIERLFKDAPPGKWDLMAFRNGNLQGAYLILAARAIGLDAGPMSGFDNAGVDAEFFAGTGIKSDFICALGYASDHETLPPRGPRPPFEEVCEIL